MIAEQLVERTTIGSKVASPARIAPLFTGKGRLSHPHRYESSVAIAARAPQAIRMCGIAGWVDFERDLSGERPIVERMATTLACRGPDAEGFWLSTHAAFAHRR